MQQVINKKLYDTAEAEQIAEYAQELTEWDNTHVEERLYKQGEGDYFLHILRWHLSPERLVNVFNEETVTQEEIILLNKEKALSWCEERSVCTDILLDEFGDLIEM